MARPTLFRHRKLMRLARVVGGRPTAIGHLELIWQSAYESGDPVLGSSDDVEELAEWRGAAGDLTKALLSVGDPGRPGFLESVDGNGLLQIHDFWEHAPDYVRKRFRREKERKEIGVRYKKEDEGPTVDRSLTGQVPVSDRRLEITDRSLTTPPALAPALAPAPKKEDPPAPRKRGVVQDGLFTEDDPDSGATASKGVTARWAVKVKRPTGVSPRYLEAAVVRVLREARQAQVSPDRSATSAKDVLSLWRVLGHPDLDLFAEEAVLVTRAAQMSTAVLFARDVRGEGSKELSDRTFNLGTLFRHDRWDDRLRAAQQWAVGTRRVREDGIALCLRDRWMDPGDRSTWRYVEPLDGQSEVTLHSVYVRCARKLFEEELAGEALVRAMGRIAEHEELEGTSADLTGVVRIALDEVGMW